jgi:hypothetical protein
MLALLAGGCGTGPEDLVDDLAHPGRREAARQQLLIAKDRAVGPLLEALADTDNGDARPELADVLVSLHVRTADARIIDDLSERLSTDPDPRVLARIARAAGLHRRHDLIEPLLASGIVDGDDDVVHQSLVALGLMRERLTEAQEAHLVETSAQLVNRPHKGVRTEARILAEKHVAELVEQGRARAVQAEMAAAESLYQAAIDLVPDNKYANYRLARLRFDAGERAEGLQRLREHGMLLDVPRTARPPRIDGRVDPAEWQGAVHASGFYSYVSAHNATIPASVETDIYLAWDETALYIGFVGHDDEPGDIVAHTESDDEDLWYEDIVELFLDASLDHQTYVHMGINTRGALADAWHSTGLSEADEAWDLERDLAVHIGEAAWSLELALRYDAERLPQPSPGSVWGFNFVRTFRGSEYSQWVRTFASGGHSPDDFGFLVFSP